MAGRLSGAERRESILRSAMGLFARRGFAGAATRELAAASGISEAMLFKHFPDKDALYRAILSRKIEQAEAVMPLRELAASEDPPEAFFGRIATNILERIEDDPSFLKLLLFSALEGHPLAGAFDRARAAGVRAVIGDYIRRNARRARLRPVDPAFASRAFLGMVGWFALARVVFEEPGSLRIPRGRLVRDIVSLYLDGLRAQGRAVEKVAGR